MSPQWTSAGPLVVVETDLDGVDFLRELMRHHTSLDFHASIAANRI